MPRERHSRLTVLPSSSSPPRGKRCAISRAPPVGLSPTFPFAPRCAFPRSRDFPGRTSSTRRLGMDWNAGVTPSTRKGLSPRPVLAPYMQVSLHTAQSKRFPPVGGRRAWGLAGPGVHYAPQASVWRLAASSCTRSSTGGDRQRSAATRHRPAFTLSVVTVTDNIGYSGKVRKLPSFRHLSA